MNIKLNKDELIDVIENAQATYSNELTRMMAKYAADAVIKYIEQRSEPVSLKRIVNGTTEQQKVVAKQMYYSLCNEFVRIARNNVGKKIKELDEYDRVQEIWALTDLLEKEYNL